MLTDFESSSPKPVTTALFCCIIESVRTYVLNDDEGSMGDDLDDCLPATMNYDLEMCSSTDCSSTIIPDDVTVVLVSRVVSGDSFEVDPGIVNLWMWR